jgi:hypothetical protein
MAVGNRDPQDVSTILGVLIFKLVCNQIPKICSPNKQLHETPLPKVHSSI